MVCNKCGTKLDDKTYFCFFCGAKIEHNIRKVEESKGPWRSFAKWGYVLGIVSLAIILCVPIVGGIFAFIPGIIGIIFSALGKKSNAYRKKATTGLILSIVSLPASFFILLILIIYANTK